jgi:3-methylcrotonyl-CoA carboxylase alpha subunit
MGIRAIAVFSEADAHARHVAMADEAVGIGPSPATESYLIAEKIIEAAKKTGAQAIHPGYGFLSENAEFAEACAKAGITFIGPPAEAIRAMGRKDAAKKLMAAAGVPVVPGYHEENQDPEGLAVEAQMICYPVLIKAVAGGGGKGMRRVEAPADFPKALKAAKREAKSSFGDDHVLIEKFVARPRHIEIQVFADSQGNAVSLHERDCSLQRRHQKVLEEAPAPNMPLEMRERMGAAAVAAAKAIGYEGAGTIEFIADASAGLDADAFYFMEMNTRLQVEHPVTEMITGFDLVEWQIRVASGEALPAQQNIPLMGHAIEARIYAEDPQKTFFPSTGVLDRLQFPVEDKHIRVDTGVREGDEVSMFYDPMIAKLVVWDETRALALGQLRKALAAMQVAGPKNNVDFLRRVAEHAAFSAADLDTGFIERHEKLLIPAPKLPPVEVLGIAVLYLILQRNKAANERRNNKFDPFSPWGAMDSWRLGGPSVESFSFEAAGNKIEVEAKLKSSETGVAFSLFDGDNEHTVGGAASSDGTIVARVDNLTASAFATQNAKELTIITPQQTFILSLPETDVFAISGERANGSIAAPMPGKVMSIAAEVGATVKRGDPLLVLEAMKMEHTLEAEADGKILLVNAAAGAQVGEGDILVEIEVAS